MSPTPSKSVPQCVITGCAFVDAPQGQAVWGDLWEVGDCWVFNAVMQVLSETREIEVAWQRDLPPSQIKQLIVRETFAPPYFERRGVIVIAKANADLNQAAKDYLP